MNLVIELEGNIELPVSSEVETLADMKKLGTKLAALPGGANKLIPGMAERKVAKLRFAKE